MADIAMCMSRACPSRSECWRHEATANPRCQQYADFESTRQWEIKCTYFMPFKFQSSKSKGKLIGGGV